MDNQEDKKGINLTQLYHQDILSMIIFIIIPLFFFLLDFNEKYRILLLVLLVIIISIYTLVRQFFVRVEKTTSPRGKFIAFAVANTVILSFILSTGNIHSPYFFIIYFLIFSVSILTSVRVFFIEFLIIFISITVNEIYEFPSFTLMLRSFTTPEILRILSIPIAVPLGIAISAYLRNLEKKQQLLDVSKELLTIQDIEGEALLAEIDQGIIVIDSSLKIIKVSKWIEKNLEITPRLLLRKNITEVNFYDAVTNKLLSPNDYLYRNLTSSAPQILNWRVLYKNQYGKYKKFLIKEIPLKVGNKIIGFLMIISYPPKTLQDVLKSFNQLLNFRLSSCVATTKNLLSLSNNIKKDPIYPAIEKQLRFITQLLNDTAIKNAIADGRQEINITRLDLQKLIKQTVKDIAPIRNILVWNVSPIYQNRPITIESDRELLKKLISYALKGSLYITKDKSINLTIDEDERVKRPKVLITAALKEELPKDIDLTEPFFSGRIVMLAKCAGSGLEVSNANLIARFLGFDFSAKIGHNKLTVKITF